MSLESSARARGLQLTVPVILGLVLLSSFAPTKQDYQRQIIAPYLAGLRAELKDQTAGIRAVGRGLFPTLAEAGRELSAAYWEEVSQKIDKHTTITPTLFWSEYRTTWAWGSTSCETIAYGAAGVVWVGSVDTCGLAQHRKAEQ